MNGENVGANFMPLRPIVLGDKVDFAIVLIRAAESESKSELSLSESTVLVGDGEAKIFPTPTPVWSRRLIINGRQLLGMIITTFVRKHWNIFECGRKGA